MTQHSLSGVPCPLAESASRSYRAIRSGGRIVQSAMAMLITASVLLTGCSGEPRAAPVDVEMAHRTLLKVLEHWKSGGKIDDFRSTTPEIVVQEELWYSGRSLLDFAVQEPGRASDANWFCDVQLTLAAEDGGTPVKRTVTYAVGTDPVLTVFHAML